MPLGPSFLYAYVVCIHICLFSYINWNTIERSILCRSRCPACCYRPGPEAEQSGHLRLLPWQHLSGSRRPECNALIYSFPCHQTTSVLSPETRRLGEFTLLLEPCYGPQLCSVGDIIASMGTSIYSSGSACTVQSREASANACIFCQRHGEDACPVGS